MLTGHRVALDVLVALHTSSSWAQQAAWQGSVARGQLDVHSPGIYVLRLVLVRQHGPQVHHRAVYQLEAVYVVFLSRPLVRR